VSVKAKRMSPTVASVLVGVAGLLVLLAGLFVLVQPQRHKATQLTTEIESTEAQIVTARALAAQRPEQRIHVADMFKVVEAMPDDTDMTGIMLQLQQTAREAGVKFESIQPQPAQPGAGYGVQALDLSFDGNYYSLTDFLFRLRKLVSVHRGSLDARGRLFSVGRIQFAPGEKGFPAINATLRVNAYVYSPAAATTGVPPAAGTTTTTSSGAVASGATP
jgi:type IV pilus assembly protein PilO